MGRINSIFQQCLENVPQETRNEVRKNMEKVAMKSIEERADKYVGHAYEIDESFSITYARRGYIEGAKDQHQIDVDKACAWLKYLLCNRWGFVAYHESIISQFRKAMEE